MISTTNDTIIAPATTYGKSSLNVLRLSGEKSIEILNKLAKKNVSIKPKEVKLLKIYFEDGNILDECIILYFKSPNSYTTEDVVEFQCHGGYFIAQNILNECIKYGARLAYAGEFTKRAFIGGRIDLSQAQAIAKLIEAKDKQSHLALMKHLNGEMRNFCNNLRSKLIELIAHSEVFIDYSDEDIPNDTLITIENKLDDVIKTLQNLLDYSKQKQAVFDGNRICIIGKPNVGKSTLLNTLLNEDRAITSDIAGTTRDSIEADFMFRGHILKLIDTAGIRDSSDIIEQEGIKRSIQKAKDSDILIAIFDGSQQLSKEDENIIDILNKENNKNIFVLINKEDLKTNLDTSKLEKFNPIKISLKDNNINNSDSSLSIFKNNLEKVLNKSDNADMMILTSQNQYESVKSCIDSIKNSKEPLHNGELEFFSFHINIALQEISKITKPYQYDEMLDSMFSNFCLGK